MNSTRVAQHIVELKDDVSSVRDNAACALGEIGDASAVPALIEALQDRDDLVHRNAADALAKIGDASAVPDLLAVLSGANRYRRPGAARALGQMGDSTTLPRKIVACARLSARQRVEALDSLRRIRYKDAFMTLRYTFPDTRTLCEIVLREDDADTRSGARTLLNWLNSDRTLLIASRSNITNGALDLLRASRGGAVQSKSEELLMSADEPVKSDAPAPQGRSTGSG